MENQTLTDVEKIRRLPWIITGDVFNMGFILLTFFGPVFLLFLDELGLEAAQIGLLLSFVPFCNIVAPFLASIVARVGYKRIQITFRTLRTLVIALLLFTPAILDRFGAEATFFWVAAIILGFSLFRGVSETGTFPWRKEAIPDTIQGKFTAVASMSTTIASIIITIGASYVIDSGQGLGRFMTLIAIGVGLGFLSLLFLAQIPGGAPVKKKKSDAGHLADMKFALHDKNFMFFLGALGIVTMGTALTIPFIPLFMKEQIGLSEGNVVLLSIGQYAGALLTSYIWGWTSDRYGSKPIMQFGLILLTILPVAWFVMPRHSDLSLYIAMAISFLVGVGTLAWQISWARYLFVAVTPEAKKSSYMALFFAWIGLVNGTGPLLAGKILDMSQNINTSLLGFPIDPYTALFGLSLTLFIFGFATVSNLADVKATPFKRLTGIFLRGNMLRALESLIQYNFSGDELARIATTERMGDSQNPLSANELIEALSDPSYNVRYQAVNSIGRMPPEPELVDALIGTLDEVTELSFAVTRSLGRLGDPRAIPPLRKLLSSGYHLIEANAARALAMLDDVESIPYLRQKLQNESNQTLRIAFATALGKLRATEATDDLFELLCQTNSDVLRGEVGLAIARIAGDERYYMQQWRSLRANPNTATGQSILALQKPAKRLELEKFIELTEKGADQFAQGNLDAGAKTLAALIDTLPTAGLEESLVHIMEKCNRKLIIHGGERMEFVLLTLHMLDTAFSQLTTDTESTD